MVGIRHVVRALLEAAVASSAAAKSLALFRKSGSGGNVIYVLYDPSTLEASLQDSGDPTNVIFGYLDVKPHKADCWGAGEVKFAAAQKGYGPLMYELAMSDFPNGIMPDRFSTSAAARNVWKRYAQRPDVKAKPFDDVLDPKTAPKTDDCKVMPDWDGEEAFLNAAYVGGGDGAGKPAMMATHKDAVTTLSEKLALKPAEVESRILDMGDEYFGSRYRDG